ncbi:MAG: ATP-binding protein [Bdellovibrionaceae bacterium]|nr:ATP-binding protein [Pseudobdellovibrionaceae bacterium]
MYLRRLNLATLLEHKSHFLFGPRSTGKTTLIEQQLSSCRMYDLLDNDVFVRLARSPKILEEENRVDPKLIVIDEIQKLPKLLDEVQRLIRKYNWRFLMTGSSARKLKGGGANMLGGRAWEARMFPLTSVEINGFNLSKYLNHGGLPHIYDSSMAEIELKNYTNIYLREEIASEGLVKNYEYFMNFLDVIALTNGQELNFESIARDAGVPPRTVQNYVQILEDTLMAYQLKPFQRTKRRKSISKSKIFLFDVGLANFIAKRGEIIEGSAAFGSAFEHFIINEIYAYLSYSGHDPRKVGPTYWRSVDQHEVDCLIADEIAIEIKSTSFVRNDHCKGLVALKQENIFKKFLIVSNDPAPRDLDNGIRVLPWKLFLEILWAGDLYPLHGS